MTDHDREPRYIREQPPTETNLQPDPMLRPGRTPWGWPLAIALAVLAIAVVLFATNQEDNDMAETTPAVTTTGSAPAQESSPRASNVAPAEQDAVGSTAERSTTGTKQ